MPGEDAHYLAPVFREDRQFVVADVQMIMMVRSAATRLPVRPARALAYDLAAIIADDSARTVEARNFNVVAFPDKHFAWSGMSSMTPGTHS
jgi:hypothetical protein